MSSALYSSYMTNVLSRIDTDIVIVANTLKAVLNLALESFPSYQVIEEVHNYCASQRQDSTIVINARDPIHEHLKCIITDLPQIHSKVRDTLKELAMVCFSHDIIVSPSLLETDTRPLKSSAAMGAHASPLQRAAFTRMLLYLGAHIIMIFGNVLSAAFMHDSKVLQSIWAAIAVLREVIGGYEIGMSDIILLLEYLLSVHVDSPTKPPK